MGAKMNMHVRCVVHRICGGTTMTHSLSWARSDTMGRAFRNYGASFWIINGQRYNRSHSWSHNIEESFPKTSSMSMQRI